ncbi:hypothetical protein [Campylobacter concisus]|uniref:hypothetical protein n=1 Tax=Campylobacter concisus TaxID=199 RepID=UPI00122CF229|nr:hypothetical protein [Campylobacter concisus]
MSSILKACVYNVKIDHNNLFAKSFKETLKDLSSVLDDVGGNGNIRILDTYKGKETSIWFDSFDYEKDFSKDEVLQGSVCFLLAKDMDFSIIEDKEKEELGSYTSNSKIRPKIPSHCIYLPSQDILIVENNTNAATIGTIKRGITNALRGYVGNLLFSPKLKENIIEILYLFLEKIESIDLCDLKLHKYLSNPEDSDGELLSIITNPNSQFKATLQIKQNDSTIKSQVVDYFRKILEGKIEQELSNIKIKYKNEKNEKETANLYDNLVFLNIEKEHYYNDISGLEENERIGYSKSIYKALIEEFTLKAL